MTYSKSHLRDFFNHLYLYLYLELEGKDCEQLRMYRNKYGIELIPPSHSTNYDENAELAEHQQWLFEHFQKLAPMFKGLVERMGELPLRSGTERVTKSFRRVIKTADYETLEVVGSVEQEIEFSCPLDRQNKIEAISQQAIEELATDLAAACKRLGIPEKRVLVRQP